MKNRLKQIRDERNLSQNQLAKIIGVSQSQISRYIRNERDMSESTIRRICEALDCSADYLLGLIDDEEIKKEK